VALLPPVAGAPPEAPAAPPERSLEPPAASPTDPRAISPPADETAHASDRPVAPSPAPAAALAIHVRPYAQRALLDGVEVARHEQVVHVSIPMGKPRQLRIEHECCAPFEREITAKEAASLGDLRVALAPRPARLRVDADPGTRVLVEGVPVGTAADSPIPVPIPGGAYVASARIRLELDGEPPREIQVELRAGETSNVAGRRAATAELSQ
jgi:serine/threonine-protein kinase